MIGYDQECAHPTIAVCHPLAVVLRRSIKLVSGMVKEVRVGQHERVLNMCLPEVVQFQDLDCPNRDGVTGKISSVQLYRGSKRERQK